MFKVGWMCAILLVAAWPSDAQAEGITATASIDPSSLYLGEAATLRITVTGANSTPSAGMPQVDGLTLTAAGVSQSTSQSITVINGQMTQSSQTTYFMNYQVTAARGGTYQVPEISVTADGHTARTAPVRLSVTAPGSDDRAWIEVAVTPNPVVIGDEFTVTFKLHLQKLSFQGQTLDIDPFLQRQPPALSIPWFESLPNTESGDFRAMAMKYLGSPGFTINGYNQGDLFSRRLVTFRLPREETTRKGNPCFVYKIERKFRAIKPGDVELLPCTIKGTLIDQVVGPNEGTQRSVYHASNAVTVRITDPPESGRPREWRGAIGRYDIHADVTPARINLGDPLTLTVTIRGDGLWSTVEGPDLSQQEEFIRNFKLHDHSAQGEQTANGKVFRYTIRPIQSGIKAVPSLRFAFYDPKRKAYTLVKTGDIPIEIHSTEKVRLEEVVEAVAKPAAPEMREVVEGLFANESNPDRLLAAHAAGGGWMAVAGGPILFLAAGAVRLVRARRDHRREAARKAFEEYRSALGKLILDMSLSEDRFASSVILETAGYIARRLMLPAVSMTPPDMLQRLREHGVARDGLDRLKDVLDRLERFRYAQATTAFDRQAAADDLIRVVGDIEEGLKMSP